MTGPAEPTHASPRQPHRYRYCGRVLASSFELPELVPAGGGRIELELRLDAARPQVDVGCDWFRQESLSDGTPWLSRCRTADGFLLRFHGLADMTLSRDGSRILCHPLPGLAPPTLRHLALDVAAPLALTLAGMTVLHAGAVATPMGAVVFVGPTGSGKSTLTAACAAGGWSAITDDALVVNVGPGGPRCLPGYPSLRLWPDSLRALFGDGAAAVRPVAHYSAKMRLTLPAGGHLYCDRPTLLRQLYLLDGGDAPDLEPRITPASKREGLLALLEAQFCIDSGDPGMARRSFEALAAIVESITVARLVYPRSFDRVTELQKLIAGHLGLEAGEH